MHATFAIARWFTSEFITCFKAYCETVNIDELLAYVRITLALDHEV